MATKPLPVHGADISHHQASVDLAKAKKSGLDWLYHKATQGRRFVDKRFKERREDARKIGLPFGAYHFAEATSSPEDQAKHFLETADIKPGDMRPMLDVEDYEQGKSFFSQMSLRARTDWVRRFVMVVERETGMVPFIYTPFDLSNTFECPLWVARYSNSNAAPRVPKPWKDYTVRQFTNGEFGVPKSFPGLGNVDLNCWKGDPAKLLKKHLVPKATPPVKQPAPKPPAKKTPSKPPTKKAPSKPPAKKAPAKPPAAKKPAPKTLDQIAQEVINGKWGNGPERVKKLKAAGYDSKRVQTIVNQKLANRVRTR